MTATTDLTGKLVTVVGTYHLRVNESVRGPQVLIKVGDKKDFCVINVPERHVRLAITEDHDRPQVHEKEPEVLGRDGTVRKAHYGSTDQEQPWDTIVRKGWGPIFAGANVLKYLRRVKSPEDLDKARWYWTAIHKVINEAIFPHEKVSGQLVLHQLREELTKDELMRLEPVEQKTV